uniref:BRD4-interacting chromatin-remodeling complex-associated protein-like isoform X5 n=1 Tax=Pristiophorus japonicus TaxID=55135 RepID=UPI00398E48E9
MTPRMHMKMVGKMFQIAVVMDDDDDRDLRDVIGDVQALNDFLHGPGSQEIDEDDLLGSACTIDNSNSLFADAISADSTSSTKDTHNHIGEELNSRRQLASSLNVLEELDTSSPLSNLNGDQPFDILQKSLQEANITQQTLQEEADLAAGITSTQEFAQTQLHPASFSQVSQLSSGASAVRGLTQQQMNVTPSPILQQVLRTPFVNNETNVQPGFFQQMGINSVAIQHVPNSNQAGGIGPIQLIGSLDTQQPVMTLNHLEGSQFISKSSGQQSALNSLSVGGYNMASLPNQQQISLNTSGLNETGGLLLQRRVTALNGNTYYGASNIGQAPKKMMATSKHQPVTSHSLASLGQLSNQVSASLFGSQTLSNSVPKAHAADGLRQPHIPSLLNSTGILGKTTCLAVQMSDSQLHKTAGTLQQHLGQLHPLQDKILGQPEMQKMSQFDGQNGGQKRPASKQLTKESLILQQLQNEQRNVLQPDYKTPFNSLEDAMQRLLPYHVFQGNLPSQEEFQKVDNEFEAVSVQLLKRTQMMLSKYRRLLLEDAMRINPSAEMVMIDRVFNQDEKVSLIQDKRFFLEDSDGYLANFCCSSTVSVKPEAETQPLTTDMIPHKSSGSSSRRSTPANATISQKSESSRLVHIVSSVASGVKAATNSPTNSPCTSKSYSSSKGLKLTIKPGTAYGTQSKSSETQEPSDTGNQGDRIITGPTSGYVEAQSTNICEPVVGTVQACEREESRSDVEEKHSNFCDKVTVEGLMKEGQDPVINQINNPIKLEHNEGDTQLAWHDQSQDKSAKNSQQQEFTSVQTKDTKEAQCDTSLHEHLESAINSILDLQQAQKPSDNAVIKNSSPEVETPHFSALAPVENYIEKCIPDHNEGIRETDSILEAAVNSILEC